jgi:hypothetical protein
MDHLTFAHAKLVLEQSPIPAKTTYPRPCSPPGTNFRQVDKPQYKYAVTLIRR